jgi:hypothetical protein
MIFLTRNSRWNTTTKLMRSRELSP